MTKYILLLLLLIGVNAPDAKSQSKTSFSPAALCNRLSELKLPPKGEAGIDPIFDAFMTAGEEVLPCLIDSITDTRRMHDPRCPAFAETVAVGDTAYFVLISKTDLEFAQFLPPAVQDKYKLKGWGAFDDYIRKKGSRRQLQLKLREWYRKRHL